MGEVDRARQTRWHARFAIKVLPSSLTDDAQFRERFDREARAMSALAHPNICTLHDIASTMAHRSSCWSISRATRLTPVWRLGFS